MMVTAENEQSLILNSKHEEYNQLEIIGSDNIEDQEDYEEEDDDSYYLRVQEEGEYMEQDNLNFYQDESEEIDEAFYLANKTFYTTCYKISRQNNPTYRKKPPYSLLENWLIHSVFSKSQQILLRFPIIHPRVMMAEGDFIYTPHQVATDNNNNQHQQYQQQYDYDDEDEDEDYDYYDDTFIIGDEGVMVMSASAPDASQFMAEEEEEEEEEEIQNDSSLLIDENMWMGHSRYNNTGLTLHVVNPDDEDQDSVYPVSSNNPYNSLVDSNEILQDEIEKEQEKHCNSNISMSPEVLEWYRSADLKPITLNSSVILDDKHNNVNCGCSSNNLCQSDHHSEISTASSSSSNSSHQSITSHHSQRTDIQTLHSDEKSVDSYQSLAEIIQEESSRLPTSYGTMDSINNVQQPVSSLMQVSVCFVDAAWVALDLAQTYAENGHNSKKGVTGFITSMFRIWKVLFLGAETMLGLGSHRLRSQAVV